MVGRTLEEISLILDLSWVTKRKKLYEVVKTKERLLYHIEKMKEAELIGFDTETDGINICNLPWGHKDKNSLVGICISYTHNQGIYIPIAHTEMYNLPLSLLAIHLFPLLEVLPLATHNGMFDYKVMYDLGVKLNIIHDSMLLMFAICSHVAKGSKKLKVITRKMYGDTTIDFEDIFIDTKDYGKFKHVSEEVARIYGCADSDYTRMIIYDAYNFLSEAQAECYMHDCSLIPMMATAEYQGKPIDMKLLPVHRKLCEENIKKLKDLLYNYVGWKLSGNIEKRYIFKETSPQELSNILYNKLHYDIVESYTKEGKLKVDSFVITRLQKRKVEIPDLFVETVIKDDVKNSLGGKKPLIGYKDMLYAECPIAFILQALSKQSKYLSTFFNKIYREANSDVGRYFSSISMTNIETARFADFIQTLAGNLKYLLAVPPNSNQYMFVFDFCQIEYRVMPALACLHSLIDKLNDPHTDFHIALAAIIMRCKPSQITTQMRKKFKPINFSIPYGTAVDGLVRAMYGIGLPPDEYKVAVIEVERMFTQWVAALPEVMAMLNNYRQMAITPRDYHYVTMPKYETPSYVQSPDGRLRIFDLKDCNRKRVASVERQAGNYPIQEYAGTIYKTAINNLYLRLIKEGLMDILVDNSESPSGKSFKNKVTINTFVHDEIGGFADSDVSPYFLYKLIREECMLKLEGHPTYFCGINIVNNWGEGKGGNFEAPIDFVDAMKSDIKIVEPKDWPKIVSKDMIEFVNNESVKYLESIGGSELVENGVFDVKGIIERWEDYYYKTQLMSFGYKYRSEPYLEDTDVDDAVNFAVGTLIAGGYKRVVIQYDNKVEIVNSHLAGSVKGEKELEYQDLLYDSIDMTESDVEIQVESALSSGDFMLEDDTLSVLQNLNLLKSLLIDG